MQRVHGETQVILGAHEHLDFSKRNFLFRRDDWVTGAKHLHRCGVYHLDFEPCEETELLFVNERQGVNIIGSTRKTMYGNFWHIKLEKTNDYVLLKWIGKGYVGWAIAGATPNLHVHSLDLPGNLLHTFCTVRRMPSGHNPDATPQPNPCEVRDFLATTDITPLSPTYGSIVNYSWASESGLPDQSIEYHHGELAHVNGQVVLVAGSLRWDTRLTPHGGSNVDMHYAFPEKHPNRSATASATNVFRAKAASVHTIHQNPYTGDLLCSYLGTPHTTGDLEPVYGPGGFINIATKPLFPQEGQGVPVSNFHIIGKFNKEEIGVSTDGTLNDDWNYDFAINHCTGTLVSTSWGPPSSFENGFDPAKPYGRTIRVYKMPPPGGPTLPERALTFVTKFTCDPVDKGGEGVVPLEVRRLHELEVEKYFVGITLPGAVDFIWKDDKGVWNKKIVITPQKLADDCSKLNIRDGSSIPGGCPIWPEVGGLRVPLVTDITISEGDEFLYVSCWLGGAVLQYDIKDPLHPKFIDGIGNIGGVKVIKPYTNVFNTASRHIKGKQFTGGSQMLRLTPDGKRLFITNSLFSSWDDEFYTSGPGSIKDNGGNLICINTGTKRGKKIEPCSVDESFGVSFFDLQATMLNNEPGVFRARAHECHIDGVSH